MFSIAPAHHSDLLLFHQLRIRAIVYHALTKYRSCERAIDFLRVDIFQLSVEDELVALLPKTHCRLFPEQNKGKDFAILNTAQLATATITGAIVHMPSAGN